MEKIYNGIPVKNILSDTKYSVKIYFSLEAKVFMFITFLRGIPINFVRLSSNINHRATIFVSSFKKEFPGSSLPG